MKLLGGTSTQHRWPPSPRRGARAVPGAGSMMSHHSPEHPSAFLAPHEVRACPRSLLPLVVSIYTPLGPQTASSGYPLRRAPSVAQRSRWLWTKARCCAALCPVLCIFVALTQRKTHRGGSGGASGWLQVPTTSSSQAVRREVPVLCCRGASRWS